MTRTLGIAALVLALGSGLAIAQTTAPQTAPSAPAAKPATPPAATGDAAHEAKFTAADKDKNGVLEGAELDDWKANLAKIDTDKNGKVSRAEFVAAAKSGVIK